MKNLLKITSLILALTLLFGLSACTKNQEKPEGDSKPQTEQTKIENIGQGQTEFTLKVTLKDGTEKEYKVHTDETTVGKALSDLQLISGTESQYGLMVTEVCGESLDYDADHMYWAFYINGEYAMTGVDSTDIDPTAVYSLVATAG